MPCFPKLVTVVGLCFKPPAPAVLVLRGKLAHLAQPQNIAGWVVRICLNGDDSPFRPKAGKVHSKWYGIPFAETFGLHAEEYTFIVIGDD